MNMYIRLRGDELGELIDPKRTLTILISGINLNKSIL